VVPKIKIITNGKYSRKMGVAFAINKDLVDENNLHHEIMIPNRASSIKECLFESMEEITELRSNGKNTQAKLKKSHGRHQRKHDQNNRRRKKKGKQIDKRSLERHGNPE